MLPHLRGHAHAGVADAKQHILPWRGPGLGLAVALVDRNVLGFDGKLTTQFHRITRVDAEVDDDLLHLWGLH